MHDPEKIATRAQHVFQELGLSGFIYYLREGVVHSLEGHAMQLNDVNQPGAQHKRRLLLERLPRLRREMQLAHPGVLDVRGRPHFSRFDPRPGTPHFSTFSARGAKTFL